LIRPKPYISIIVSGRNDNYGGDFYSRLQNQVSTTAYLAQKYKVSIEYVLVNYNPIVDRKPLSEVIKWPMGNDYFMRNIVTVPAEVHEQLIDPKIRKTLPLFEFIAKNYGIRRCQGEYILTTNGDIVFDPKIFAFLSTNQLQKNTLYRSNRLDYHTINMMFDEAQAALFYKSIRRNVFKYFLIGRTYIWQIKGWFVLKYRLLRLLNHVKLLIRKVIRSSETIMEAINRDAWEIAPESFFYSNASGDFLLIHRDWYYKMRGFPEDVYISTHVDSLMVSYAHIDGLNTVLLPGPVYHQEHERRFVFDTPMGDADMQKMYRRLQKEIFVMKDWGKVWIHNDEHWGLSALIKHKASDDVKT
jgi:hypothetical protein